MTTDIRTHDQPREQRDGAGSDARRRKGRSVPPCNANDDILSADDRAALEVVLVDQEKAKLEPLERLERHFRAGHFILRGDTYATLRSNGHMGKVYARAAGEWIRASGVDRHPLLRRPATRTNLRKMAKNETAVRVWFFGTPERDDLGNEWPGLDIDEQTKIGHPDKIWEHFHDFLSAIFAAAGFKSDDEALADQFAFIVPEDEEEDRAGDEPKADEESGGAAPGAADQAEIDAAQQAEEAEAAKQAEETERERQEQAERNRRNHLAEFNRIARHDIDKLTHPAWEKESDPIKAERKAIEQLDRDLRWLESDLMYGDLNLPALIRGLCKDETAREETLERLETWACFIAGLRSKLTTTPTPEPDHKESDQPADPAPAEPPITPLAEAAEAAVSPGGGPEADAGKNPPRALSGENAAADAVAAEEPKGACIASSAAVTTESAERTDDPNAPDSPGPERPCWIEPEGGWQQRWGGDRRGQVPKHLREPSPSRKALEAARRGLSLSEIMRVCGVSKTMASVAGFVAKHGTPAEIFMIEMDKASCSTTAKKIRDRQERERVATVLKAIQDNPGITSHDVFWETGVAVAVLYVLKKSGLVLHRAGGWHLTERGREWLVKNCPPTPTAAKAEEPAS